MARQIDEERLRGMIEIAIQVAGSQKGFAREAGISEQYLSDIRKRRRSLAGATRILEWFGLEAVTYYRRKDGGSL